MYLLMDPFGPATVRGRMRYSKAPMPDTVRLESLTMMSSDLGLRMA